MGVKTFKIHIILHAMRAFVFFRYHILRRIDKDGEEK
jgi:hypothetical protein